MDSSAVRFRLSKGAKHFISNVQADTKAHTANYQIDAINISAGLSVPGAQLYVSKTKPIEIRVPVFHFQPKKESEQVTESSLRNPKKYTGFSWFPCIYKRMLRWFPSFQVATTCLSCSPPDLNFLVTIFFHICVHVK